jgi:hypothetical protein
MASQVLPPLVERRGRRVTSFLTETALPDDH